MPLFVRPSGFFFLTPNCRIITLWSRQGPWRSTLIQNLADDIPTIYIFDFSTNGPHGLKKLCYACEASATQFWQVRLVAILGENQSKLLFDNLRVSGCEIECDRVSNVKLCTAT
jgi:hypothetical protein